MNSLKKVVLAGLPALLLATSCVDSLDEYNVDPKNPSSAPATSFFSSAQRSLARTISSSSVNLNPFRFYVQYWTETTYTDESNYDIETRVINRSFWNAMYRDDLRNLKEARDLTNANASLDAKVKANQLAAIEVMEVYSWSVLVDTYGNVPYTAALDVLNPQPKYDDAATIYADITKRLDAAIAAFDPSADGFGNADIMYQGDVSHWVKFANSLKLRLALTLSDVDKPKATTMATQAMGKVFTSNDDDAQITFQGSFPNTNPVWEDLIQSGRKDFVGTVTFIDDALVPLNDPRLPVYFKPNKNGEFTGGDVGLINDYASFSAPGAKQEEPTLPGVLLSYSEVEFLLAEAVERGLITGSTAASHYKAGIVASIEDNGGSAADAEKYYSQPDVTYATAKGDYREKIGFQKWIALYDQPVESWKEFRRLDSPALEPGEDALSDIPLRFTYPTTEKNLNGVNNTAAATAIGGDKVSTKIFWDKK
ncbi:SusD/RagB family nutrient-binding outer membrane lipoprotein [Hymenobacter chitinivorans]|uniref:SusD-like starch-binding protein associating with outer membrane n=1 Tax=Hymenobacter chitinivorans DSM 11115 TaxID=1121954 RepID=A0A2M9AQE9_9BACT|nr:SusD/RagB family nutrient-binding outer membrane lipoprotein [Hymenobacter chitinivorans]PJJ47925.1 SusD-like starch-binding protein associating with outer membrane [Hymenobacter chitinivorans DSM 11115]